jgi:hypothetical protein
MTAVPEQEKHRINCRPSIEYKIEFSTTKALPDSTEIEEQVESAKALDVMDAIDEGMTKR